MCGNEPSDTAVGDAAVFPVSFAMLRHSFN